MENNMEKECSALGGLFQAIINDLKNGVPVWEDFLAKATKFHSQLKATILAATAFLDAFQKIADLATNTKGATKEIGTALTRICLRHKAVEAKLKTFTSAIMECLILPLQDKMEEWKKTVTQLDKDHAKDYKRARQEIKKRSSDTLRLQKKVRKGKCEIQRNLDTALQDVSDKFLILEETEKHALRTALIEERSRFCLFVSYLKPVVDEEVSMLSETSHFQEIMEQLLKSTTDPFTLPVTSEQVINDIKSFEGSWTFQTPPSSPSLISSRKSSMCSISSVNSSSSGSTKCHSPSLHMRYRSSQQPFAIGTLRLSSVSSQDSGFTSQDTLFVRPHTPPPLELIRQMSGPVEQSINSSTSASSTSSTPSSPYGMLPVTTATWPNLQETSQFDKVPCMVVSDRPHTISTAYERGHQRPPLTIHTFEPLDKISRQVNSTPSSPQGYENKLRSAESPPSDLTGVSSEREQPTIPQRAVGMDKPTVPHKATKFRHTKSFSHYSPTSKGVSLPDFNQPAPDQIVPQPLYVNMNEIARTPDIYQRQVTHSGTKYADATDVLTELQQQQCGSQYSTSIIECQNNYTSTGPSSSSEDGSPAGYPNAGHYGTLQSRTGSLRRSGSQNHKPPPPVRRTSSITSQHALTVVHLRNAQSSQTIASSSSYSLSASTEMAPTNKLSHPFSDGNLDKCLSQFEDSKLTVSAAALPSQSSLLPSLNGKSRQEFYLDEDDLKCPGGASVSSTVSGNTTDDGVSSTVAVGGFRKDSVTSDTATPVRKTSIIDKSVAANQAVLIQSLNAKLAMQQSQMLQNAQQQHPPTSLQQQKQQQQHLPTPQQQQQQRSPTPQQQQQQRSPTPQQQHQQRSPTPQQQHQHPTKDLQQHTSQQHHLQQPQHHQQIQQHRILQQQTQQQLQQQNSQQQTKHHLAEKQLHAQKDVSSESGPRASPSSLSSNSLNNSENQTPICGTKVQQSSQPVFHETFLMSLNEKLAHHVQKNAQVSPQSTPKSQRRSSAPAETHLNISPLQNFKLELNAKLAQQNATVKSVSSAAPTVTRQDSIKSDKNLQLNSDQHGGRSSNDQTSKVREMMANRVPYDPITCRESMLDQIKRGTTLRKVSTNDRSAPKIQ